MPTSFPRPASIPTPASLRATNNRLAKRRRQVDRALEAMRKGDALYLSYENGRPCWHLTGGSSVASDAAAFLITLSNIVGCDDSLLPGHHQTWRYAHD
jgi:hypothetical protein